MSLNYLQEKAYQTLSILAASEGGLCERLTGALDSGFSSLEREGRTAPAGLDPRLISDLTELLTKCTGDESGSVRATLETFDEFELLKIAEQALGLCVEVMQYAGEDSWNFTSNRD